MCNDWFGQIWWLNGSGNDPRTEGPSFGTRWKDLFIYLSIQVVVFTQYHSYNSAVGDTLVPFPRDLELLRGACQEALEDIRRCLEILRSCALIHASLKQQNIPLPTCSYICFPAEVWTQGHLLKPLNSTFSLSKSNGQILKRMLWLLSSI